ncbi:MAG TPA: hypothetical protein VKT53_05830 [Candidatus Acidoferrum sp.]|nr:hypothetical protein [Candidatus Acidoferrum sp.]
MKKVFLAVTFLFSIAGLAHADQINLAATCDPTSPTICATPTNLIGGPVSLTVGLGSDKLVFTSAAATQVVQGGITSYDSYFANGGGTVQIFDSHNHLVGLGTFLPGATSISDQGGQFSTFDGDIAFSFLKGNKLGLSPHDNSGTGHFSYSFDATLGLFGDTSSYDLTINGDPPPTPAPEPATALFLLVGLGVAVLARSFVSAK